MVFFCLFACFYCYFVLFCFWWHWGTSHIYATALPLSYIPCPKSMVFDTERLFCLCQMLLINQVRWRLKIKLGFSILRSFVILSIVALVVSEAKVFLEWLLKTHNTTFSGFCILVAHLLFLKDGVLEPIILYLYNFVNFLIYYKIMPKLLSLAFKIYLLACASDFLLFIVCDLNPSRGKPLSFP